MIQRQPFSVRFCGTVAALAGLPVVSVAGGFRLPDQDAFATGRGEAFAATADNASAIYYNPAGIGNLEGHNVRLGAYGLKMDTSYDSPAGGSFDNSKDLAAVPQLFYSYGMKETPLALGLGLYSPYGLSSEWAEDSGFRSVALEGSMTYWTVNPVVAWRVLPTLSVAAGATINQAKTELKQGLSPVPGNDYYRFEGDGLDVGFNAGILWRPHPKLSFGASYRSATEVELDGATDTVVLNPLPGLPAMAVRLDAKAPFQFPQSGVAGVSFRPTPDWNIEVDVEYTDWNQLNSLSIRQPDGAALGLPPAVESVFNWESSWYYEFGITRYLGEHWALSLGYVFNQNAIPDATYTPMVADLDRHFVSAGLGYAGKTLQLDLAYQFGYGPERTVSGSALTAAGQSADGDYSFLSHALLATLGLRF